LTDARHVRLEMICRDIFATEAFSPKEAFSERLAQHIITWASNASAAARKAFVGIGGDPSTDNNIVYTSVRYYPF
jgi:hypothetical protein